MKSDITSTTLTKEINKILPSSSLFSTFAYDVKDQIGSVIKMDGSINKVHYKKIYEDVITKLSTSPYLDNNFVVVFRTDINDDPIVGSSFYVFGWNNKAEEYKALESKLAYEMESLLEVQKIVLRKKQNMVSTLKLLKKTKDELNDDTQLSLNLDLLKK